ncbi:hypothetical protein PTTG_11009 [Puccinia triticina 1-1 BBBD Race 1]|uniref:Uncharacterized protein n=1 Tax=Puccinia triticina (isolate 1-1 / race 1 (BBBD)) TaxID=630390 RepID=A0A180GMU6_PUCT1|nr:hypothetical protein PTTG_11009 [Puccinia triticina 1-1 BBBD Race 1]
MLTLILRSFLATSSQDKEPKRYKQTLPLSSTLVTDADPDRTGSSSLSNRITNPTSGDNTRSGSLASRIGQR